MISRTTQWLNSNAHRKYPFIEDSIPVLTNLSGPIVYRDLPDSVVLDFKAVLYLHNTNAGDIWIRLFEVEVTANNLILTFGIQPYTIYPVAPPLGDPPYDTIQFLIPISATVPYTVTAKNNYGYFTIVIGDGLSTVVSWGIGRYIPRDIMVIEPALITFLNKSRMNDIVSTLIGSTAVKGAVEIEEGYNCKVSITANEVQLNAGKGAGKGLYCGTDDDGSPCKDTLLRINGMQGGETGDFRLACSNGVEMTTDKANHVITFKLKPGWDDLACHTTCGSV